MAFYYAKEKREFDWEWEQLRREYEAAGMSEENIQALYDFDWQWFCSRRRFMDHTQSLPAETIDGEDSREQSSLIRKFASFSVCFDEFQLGGRYGWVEEIEDSKLLDKLRKLSDDDLELLTLIAIEGYSQSELARMGFEKQYKLSRRITRIKKFLKKSK